MKRQVPVSSETHHCDWLRFSDAWDYETECDNYFGAEDMRGSAMSGFIFCPFCGRKINRDVVGEVCIL